MRPCACVVGRRAYRGHVDRVSDGDEELVRAHAAVFCESRGVRARSDRVAVVLREVPRDSFGVEAGRRADVRAHSCVVAF